MMDLHTTLPQLYAPEQRPILPVNAGGALASHFTLTKLEAEEPTGGLITVRLATMEQDWEFIESLQKPIRRQVGWWTPGAVNGYIQKDGVLIAERRSPSPCPLPEGEGSSGEQLGFIFFADTYRRQENLGVIYHVNVKPMRHRKLVGARLVREAFMRSPYGVRLFCCWCAQDMEANYFWESIGFVPIAFRTGSRNGERIHIFWQRRVREGDTDTPYWYPYQTTGGQLNEQRLVLPIPPGTRWQDAKPVVLPKLPAAITSDNADEDARATRKADEDARAARNADEDARAPQSSRPATLAELRAMEAAKRAATADRKKSARKVIAKGPMVSEGRVREGQPLPEQPCEAAAAAKKKAPAKKRKSKAPAVKGKHDRAEIGLSRELRDRYLEQMNEYAAALPPAACGKWNVSDLSDMSDMSDVSDMSELSDAAPPRMIRSREGIEVVDAPYRLAA